MVAKLRFEIMERNKIFDKFQSGFSSMETALLRVTNDILMTARSGNLTVLILLDSSTGFDTVDHTTLPNRLRNSVDLGETALCWFLSDLDRVIVDKVSPTALVSSEVPQGSVLGPTLFNFVSVTPWPYYSAGSPVSWHC